MQQKNPRIVENYQTIMPYLIINGAESFIRFMKIVFEAEVMLKEMRDENKIRHGELNIGGSTIMFADSTDQFETNTGGFFIYIQQPDDAFKRALDTGATKISEMENQPYGRSGGVKDNWGNTWWITGIN